MEARTGHGKRARHWLWAVIAVIAIAGASSAAFAKEKSKTPSASKGGETGNSGYIGVYMQELTADVRKGLDLDVKQGVLVSGVEDDAPAALAGIEEGDVITKFNGKAVTDPDDLRDAVSAIEPGKKANVELVRDGKTRTVTVTVTDRPERQTFHFDGDDFDGSFAPMHMGRNFAMFGGPRLGISAHELDDDGLASYFGVKKGEGVLVLEVEDESVASKAGVKSGDIISKIGNDQIEDTRDIRKALNDYDEGDQFDITVLRHGKTQSLKATMDEQKGEFAFDVPSPGQFHWRAPRAPHAHQRAARVYRSR
jgi:serine protease Do